MNGNEVLRQALILLNYTDTHGDGEVPGGAGLYKRALATVNQIVAELWYQEHSEPFQPLSDLHQPLPLSAAVVQTVVPYGVAMLLAQEDGDADNQTVYAALYDGRRAAATHNTTARIADALPTPSE